MELQKLIDEYGDLTVWTSEYDKLSDDYYTREVDLVLLDKDYFRVH